MNNFYLRFQIYLTLSFILNSYQENFPFVTLVQSPGLAFFILPGQEEGKALLQGMNSLKPLIILMFLFVSISGVCFWLCETITLSLAPNEDPEVFEHGRANKIDCLLSVIRAYWIKGHVFIFLILRIRVIIYFLKLVIFVINFHYHFFISHENRVGWRFS